jgi:para-aminobenzoate synthetase component 1
MFLNSSLEAGTGRYAVLGIEPELIFWSKGKKVEISYQNGRKYKKKGDVLKILDYYFRKFRVEQKISSKFPFNGGAIGYFAYEFGRQIESCVPRATQDKVRIPDLYLGFYRNLYVEDKLKKKTYLVYDEQKNYTKMKRWIEVAREQKQAEWKKPEIKNDRGKEKKIAYNSNFTKQEYLQTLKKIKAYLRAGEVYQVCLTQTLTAPYLGKGDQLYLNLCEINPAPFSAYLHCGGFEIISSSPERFMKVEKGIIETCPIKGTIKRGAASEEDERLKQELLDSEKEKAELTMIVDLERNDLGKICEFGTVKVVKHRELKAYPTVFHTVSTIRGKLRDNIFQTDIMRAVFPGGSITGAPKIRAMEILAELESTTRGAYTGSIGYFGFDGYMDTSIVIRTILLKKRVAYLGVGGGIVLDSDPEKEFRETMLKARAQLRSMEG